MTKDSVEVLQQQQEHQEGRLSTLEAEVRHVIQAVGTLTDALESGFRETREMVEAAQRRGDQRTSELHHRLDEQAKDMAAQSQQAADRSRWNPGLTVAAITCAVLVGGIFVAFVNLTQAPMNKANTATQAAMTAHQILPGHTETIAREREMRGLIIDAHYEIEKLHGIALKSADNYVDSVQRITRVEEQSKCFMQQLNQRWASVLQNAIDHGRTIEHMRERMQHDSPFQK